MNIVLRDECDDCGVATSCEPALLLYLTTPRFQERDNAKWQKTDLTNKVHHRAVVTSPFEPSY